MAHTKPIRSGTREQRVQVFYLAGYEPLQLLQPL
jgi:hypothetical protein